MSEREQEFWDGVFMHALRSNGRVSVGMAAGLADKALEARRQRYRARPDDA